MDYSELVKKIPVDHCHVCRAPRNMLWLKDIRVPLPGICAILYKCAKCAYVNTTLTVKFQCDIKPLYAHIEYHLLGKEGDKVYGYTLDGEKHLLTEDYPLFGREFHGVPPRQRDINCPICGAKMKLESWNPFIRITVGTQYRCDVFYRCSNGHTAAFGVHVTPEDFDVLNVRRR